MTSDDVTTLIYIFVGFSIAGVWTGTLFVISRNLGSIAVSLCMIASALAVKTGRDRTGS